MNLRQVWIAFVCGAIVGPASMPMKTVRGQQLTAQQALQEIRNTAAEICQSAPLEQTNQGMSLSGEANAKIGGLLGKLADLEVTGAGQYQTGSSRGVLQKDLITAIQSANDCKLQVFMALQAKLLAGPPGSANNHGTVIAPRLPAVNISGRWRDNWGNSYQITQQDNEFTYSAMGISCKSIPFQSTGRGTVSGNIVESNYQSSIGSRGECSGTILRSGMSMNCNDTICGPFSASVSRQ